MIAVNPPAATRPADNIAFDRAAHVAAVGGKLARCGGGRCRRESSNRDQVTVAATFTARLEPEAILIKILQQRLRRIIAAHYQIAASYFVHTQKTGMAFGIHQNGLGDFVLVAFTQRGDDGMGATRQLNERRDKEK